MTIERGDVAALSDDDLVAAVRAGDDVAFERLYGRYKPRVGGFVRGMVGDEGRAEDVTQEVFLAALRRMRSTERPIAFRPWVYEIARNAAIDDFRRARRSREVPLPGEDHAAGSAETLPEPGPTPDRAVEARETLNELQGALGALSDTHRRVIVLRELEGRSYREIGERLELSRPAVESTLFRARHRLAQEYDELTSGRRCHRVVATIDASPGRLGVRDARRVTRHLAHCQSCRRHAQRAGVCVSTLQRPITLAGRAAAWLPLPGLVALRRGAGHAHGLSGWTGVVAVHADPVASWGKAVVATAAILVAGGVGAAGHRTHVGLHPTPAPAHVPAAVHAPAPAPASARPRRTRRTAPAIAAPRRERQAHKDADVRAGKVRVVPRSHGGRAPATPARSPRHPVAPAPPSAPAPAPASTNAPAPAPAPASIQPVAQPSGVAAPPAPVPTPIQTREAPVTATGTSEAQRQVVSGTLESGADVTAAISTATTTSVQDIASSGPAEPLGPVKDVASAATAEALDPVKDVASAATAQAPDPVDAVLDGRTG